MMDHTAPDGHRRLDHHVAPQANYADLRLCADMFFDMQEFRMAMANKARSGHTNAFVADEILAGLEALEHTLKLDLARVYRAVAPPAVIAWQKREGGIGQHLLARLLGAIGDPAVATPMHWEGRGTQRVLVSDEPHARSLHQLWAYCGHGDPARRPRKGMTAEDAFQLGNPKAKMIVHLLAESCVKAGVRVDPETGEKRAIHYFGQVYLDSRDHYVDAVHADDCIRCGPSGRPAKAGSDLSNAHKHARALRKVGKEILRDLWKASREGREFDLGHVGFDSHRGGAEVITCEEPLENRQPSLMRSSQPLAPDPKQLTTAMYPPDPALSGGAA